MGKSFRENPDQKSQSLKRKQLSERKKYKTDLRVAELEYELYINRIKSMHQGF